MSSQAEVTEQLVRQLKEYAAGRASDVARGAETPRLAGLLIRKYGLGLVDAVSVVFDGPRAADLIAKAADEEAARIDPFWREHDRARWAMRPADIASLSEELSRPGEQNSDPEQVQTPPDYRGPRHIPPQLAMGCRVLNVKINGVATLLDVVHFDSCEEPESACLNTVVVARVGDVTFQYTLPPEQALEALKEDVSDRARVDMHGLSALKIPPRIQVLIVRYHERFAIDWGVAPLMYSRGI